MSQAPRVAIQETLKEEPIVRPFVWAHTSFLAVSMYHYTLAKIRVKKDYWIATQIYKDAKNIHKLVKSKKLELEANKVARENRGARSTRRLHGRKHYSADVSCPLWTNYYLRIWAVGQVVDVEITKLSSKVWYILELSNNICFSILFSISRRK